MSQAQSDLPCLGENIGLPEFRSTVGELTGAERRVLIDQALLLIEEFYVHLPLKRAMHAIDPVQRLKLLRRKADDLGSELQFHRELLDIFLDLRDLHTNYVLPQAFAGHVAFLPVQVEEFIEDDKRRYMVTKTFGFPSDAALRPGAIVTHWNAVPIETAVDRNAELEAGSNAAASRARGLDRMTLRPLAMTLPPDEEWVVLTYETATGTAEEKLPWRVIKPDPPAIATDPNDAHSAESTALGLDLVRDANNHVRKLLFADNPAALEARSRESAKAASVGKAVQSMGVEADASSIFLSILQFRRINSKVGYLRIHSFSVSSAQVFADEVIRILGLLPQTGLILDVRNNGGGLIMAAERLLQLFTDRRIEPQRFHFINTPLTHRLCQSQLGLAVWERSTALALSTGAIYSQGFPIESPEDANSLGRQYPGPVVLITDALCYSATDMFAAGFKDHDIGTILGTADNTGAGGANVWTHELLRQLYPAQDSPFAPLPRGASMRVSIRRTTRVGANVGLPVEDLGVRPDKVHKMTKRDLLDHNVDLIAHAIDLLGV
jgi:hypothetical protein